MFTLIAALLAALVVTFVVIPLLVSRKPVTLKEHDDELIEPPNRWNDLYLDDLPLVLRH